MSDQGDKPSLPSVSEQTGTLQTCVGACRDLLLTDMPKLIGGLFVKLDEMHMDLADKAASDGIYAAYAEAMRFIHGRRDEIRALFLAELEKSCDGKETRGVPLSPILDFDRGHAELDPARAAERQEDLVLHNLVSKAENRYRAQLDTLRVRLSDPSASAPGAAFLRPRAICGAFRTALEPLHGLDLSTKLVVYKLFDKQVMDGLEGLYLRCLECTEGVAASAVDAVRMAAGSPAPTVVPRPFTPYAIPPSSGERRRRNAAPAGGAAAPLFQDLRRLLARHRLRDADAPDLAAIGTEDLLAILAGLETELAHCASCTAQARLLRMRLRDRLRLRTGSGGQLRLAAVDEDAIDLVLLLFENMLQGNDLDPTVNDLLGQLQIPVARLVLQDKGFFDDARHPARRLLNHLAESAVGWLDDGQRGPESVPGRIDEVVAQVLRSPQRDPQLYARLDAAFARVLSDDQKRVRELEERARRETQEREKRLGAESVVRNCIKARLSVLGEVPEVVTSLVYEGWEQVLLAAYQESGPSGEPWRRNLEILDWLLWSVQPKLADDERRELLRGIPELLRTLREALDKISYDRRRLAAEFRELQALHNAVLRDTESEAPGGTPQTPSTGLRGQARTRSRPVWAPRPTGSDSGSARHAGPARSPIDMLSVGSWVEVLRDDGAVRAKLAWRGPDNGVFLLVDRRGRKVLERTAEGLEELFAKGEATLIGEPDSPIVDRAIERLALALKLP